MVWRMIWGWADRESCVIIQRNEDERAARRPRAWGSYMVVVPERI